MEPKRALPLDRAVILLLVLAALGGLAFLALRTPWLQPGLPATETPLGRFVFPPATARSSSILTEPLYHGAVVQYFVDAGSGFPSILITSSASVNGCRVAEAFLQDGTAFHLLLDGVSLPGNFSQTVEVSFSPDGRRFAYVFPTGNRSETMLVADARSWHFPFELNSPPRFSADNRHVLIEGGSDPKVFVVDGVALPLPSDRHHQQFSSSEGLPVEAETVGTKIRLVINGIPGLLIDGVSGSVQFTADGTHYAYAANDRGKSFVVLDGRPHPLPSGTTGSFLQLSPDGRHYSFVAPAGGAAVGAGRVVYVDGVEQPIRVQDIGSVVFSADWNHYAYIGTDSSGDFFVVKDGVAAAPSLQPAGHSLKISVDGAHLAYLTRIVPNALRLQQQVVLDGTPGPAYTRIIYYAFSPDGKHFAYLADGAGGRVFVMDGKAYPAPGALIGQFSPNGHFAYDISVEDKFAVVVDGVKGPLYDALPASEVAATVERSLPSPTLPPPYAGDPVIFSRDGRHFAYAAAKDGKTFIVLDQVPQTAYDQIVAGPVRRADGALEYLAARKTNPTSDDGVLYRVVLPGFSPPGN